jgi:hypothetical protein
MIGGTDVVLWVRDDLPAADLILRTVRRHWPGFVFQDADDPNPPRALDTFVLPTPSGREFIVYRDRRKPEAGLRSLTLVCGRLSGEMAKLIDDVRAGFRDVTESVRRLPDPDRRAA